MFLTSRSFSLTASVNYSPRYINLTKGLVSITDLTYVNAILVSRVDTTLNGMVEKVIQITQWVTKQAIASQKAT